MRHAEFQERVKEGVKLYSKKHGRIMEVVRVHAMMNRAQLKELDQGDVKGRVMAGSVHM